MSSIPTVIQKSFFVLAMATIIFCIYVLDMLVLVSAIGPNKPPFLNVILVASAGLAISCVLLAICRIAGKNMKNSLYLTYFSLIVFALGLTGHMLWAY